MVGLVVGSLGGTLGLIFGAAFYFTGRGLEAELAAFRRGEWLARWAVPRDRWRAWTAKRRGKPRLAALLLVAILVVTGC